MDRALSGQDIYNAFDGKIRILLYSDLKKFKTMDQILRPYGRCAILYFWKYVNKNAYGHWVCVFKNINGNIEVFDSLATGKFIDGTLQTIDKTFRKNNGEDYKYLTKLLIESPLEVEFNDKKLQNNINIDRFYNLKTLIY